MSIFGAIRDSIFGAARAGTQQQAQRPAQSAGLGAGANAMPQMGGQAQQPVDVEQTLERIQRDKGDPKLNWKSSIVDLMKLLDLDPSLDNRKALADELGYSGEKDGSAQMNMWLHRKVMEELEKNGGRVPAGLKD